LHYVAAPLRGEGGASFPCEPLSRSPRKFEIVARDVDVRINLLDSSAATMSVVGELHGFGLPTSRLAAVTQLRTQCAP
jgi:hypothetical protein